MKFNIDSSFQWLLPGGRAYRQTVLLFLTAAYLKLLCFNLLWCLSTTFISFITFEMWFFNLLAALILTAPYVFIRRVWAGAAVLFALDLFLVSNLLYFRTYNTIIPLHSYGLLGNLNDFKASVIESFRWPDAIFFLITAGAAWLANRIRARGAGKGQSFRRPYHSGLRFLILPALLFLVLYGVLQFHGGFDGAYRRRLSTNQFASVVPMYTIGGSLVYQMSKSGDEYTTDIGSEIELWLAGHNSQQVYNTPPGTCENVIIILAESFESWVIELEYEGKEVTPNINRFLKGENVFYAPYVQSQAKGGALD